ncbi:MAG TPA: shikimate dehydrogenase, partial [Acidothermaceae bacterium]|nr:shikimate dehydrogenase [Acidothermaceae bacterium]
MTRLSVVPPLRRAAVLGSPIEHSLSPVLHAAAYRVLGLGWSYQAIECDELQLPAVLAGLDESFVGLSLTMPLKRAVLPLLDDLSELARAVGAANTVLFEGIGPFLRRRGENTDVPGIVAAIRAVRPHVGGGGAAILGAGGTAAAALAALREFGVAKPTVIVRNRDRAAELLGAADRLGVVVDVVDWPGSEALAAAELVISTVPAGASDSLASLAEDAPLGPGQLLFDVLYDPWPTPFAAAAQAAGAEVIGGLELLVWQAA